MDSHVSIGVDAAVLLHILHLCWVNMLNLLNSLRLDTGDRVYHHDPAGDRRSWGGGCWGQYLRLDRHLLGGARRLDRHAGLKRDCGGGVSACFRGLHGA